MNEIEKNLYLINTKIKKACETYGRKASTLSLIAVSKTVDSAKISQAIAAGVKNFGENYIKEAQEKWPALKQKFPETKLHFIGHLQSNKAALAVDLFDCIMTVDSEKLAREIKKECLKQNKNPEIFIQVNIGQEAQKGGIEIAQVVDFIDFVKNNCQLNLTGLMCIPPADELASPYFALLAKIARENNLKQLSIGMSNDFEEAIAMGSTHIRLGTAIFGARS